jgi:hypothetical protein
MRKAYLILMLMVAATFAHAGGVILGPYSAWRYLQRGSTTPGPYPWDVPWTNSVLLWELATNSATQWDNSYVGTNTGTLGAGAAAPTFVAATGGVSACYSFDGGDWIYRKQIVALTGTGNKSATMWVMGTNNLTPLSFGSLVGDGGLWEWKISKNDFYFQVDNGNRGWTTPVRNAGVWYHFASGHSAANTTNSFCYLNSVALPIAGTAARAIDTKSGTNYIGRSFNPAGAVPWLGKLDSPRIYTRAITATEIATNFWMTATNHGWSKWDFLNRNGLFLNQKFSGSANYSGALADQSTNGLHAVLGAGGSAPTWIGRTNGAYYAFDGSADYALIPASSAFTKAIPFSVSAWVYRDTTNTVDFILTRGSTESGGARDFQLAFNAGHILAFVVFSTNTPSVYIARVATYNGLANWSHVCAVYTGGVTAASCKIYKNGLQVDSSNSTGGTFVARSTTQRSIVVGGPAPASSGVNYFDGAISDLKIFNIALTTAQVTNIYAATKYRLGL